MRTGRRIAAASKNSKDSLTALLPSVSGRIPMLDDTAVWAIVANADAALRWLDAQPPDLGEVRQALRGIIGDGNRTGEVIARIRGLINKVPPRRDPLDMNQAISDATTLTRTELIRHSIALQIRLARKPPVVQGDRIQLQQVLLNLIVNAVESMSALTEGPRELEISSASDAPDSVLIAVRDSGPGLTPEDFERAFRAFHTTKPRRHGIGAVDLP
jgi:C4-dicarboxylate-specific signal transduction histidine kinase